MNKISEYENLLISTILEKKMGMKEACIYFDIERYSLNIILNKLKKNDNEKYNLIQKQFLYKRNLARTIKGLNNNNHKLYFKSEEAFLKFIELYAEKYLNGTNLTSIKIETGLTEKNFCKYINIYLSRYNNDLYQKLLDNSKINDNKFIDVIKKETIKKSNHKEKGYSIREEKRKLKQEEERRINELTIMLREKNRIN